MISRLPVALGLALFVAGCGQGNKPPPSTAATNATQEENRPVAPEQQAAPRAPAAVQPVVVATSEVVAPDLTPLTQAVQVFIFRQKRRPNSVAELVAAGYVKNIPPLPPGKKLVISPTTPQVIMVDQ